ncbi:MAG: fatty acid desaturase [Candidatus Omnitrophica bacterium]|nr:fatty acid desaturase [Candidatus Omnitrophota bacterium]
MTRLDWVIQLSRFEDTDVKKSIKQILTSFIPYFALLSAMVFLLKRGFPYWFVLVLAFLASLFLVRIFVILHDCSHKSYLGRSLNGCFILGHICGILAFTSLFAFRRSHVIHHATFSNLEKRGVGDIWTLTVDEYRSSPLWKRFVYRVFRNPFFLFLIAPPILFIILNRIPKRIDRWKEILSILFTDVMIALILLVAHWTIGLKMYAAIQLPVIYLASCFGVWIFFIHHQFEDTYWADNKNYDIFKAAMEGSSFYKLPKVLAWFTGNIGYHHVHHLNFRVPNFNLKDCYDQTPEVQQVKPLTLLGGFKCMHLALWDESTSRLINFSALKGRERGYFKSS